MTLIRKPIYLSIFLFCQWISFPQLLTAQDFVSGIRNIGEFRKMSGKPLSAKYGQVDAIKVVMELRNEKLYFINSSAFEIHFQFCEQVLSYGSGHEHFNNCNYSSDPACREYLLANVNYFRGPGVFVFEVSPLDYIRSEDIIKLFNAVKESVYFGKSMKLLLNSSRLEDLYRQTLLKVPVITPLEVFSNQKYQKISAGTSYGYLRLVKDRKMLAQCKPSDIVLVEGSLIDFPPVAGIITMELQTPLSHISVLSVNRKIPAMAFVDAMKDSAILSLAGEYVRFTVSSEGYSLKKSEMRKQTTKRKQKPLLDTDFSTDTLIGAGYLSRKSSHYAGNKAAYFGELIKISSKCGFKTPESSFAIPFFFYNQHMIQSGADTLLTNLLGDTNVISYPDTLRKRLKQIRKRIESFPLDSTLSLALDQRIVKEGKYTRMRFRSSTNAEDMKGFSGAGLYESKTGIVNDSAKSVANAVKKVWASTWNYNAFAERELFGINQETVAMGILVHRSYPNETANGVAITKNIYRPENYGFTLNIQLGEEAVVKPSDSIVCEQLICYPRMSNEFFRDKQIVEIITYSSLSPRQLILTDAELLHLANTLDKIKHHFHLAMRPGSDYLEFGLDVEFKYDGPGRTLYIDQVRPYND